MDKPQLPRSASYRHPETGKFIKRSEWEQLAAEGKRGSVTMSSAVSNKQLNQYMSQLAQKTFEHGFSHQFEKEPKQSSEQLEKLFESMVDKIVSKLGAVSSSMDQFKKQNSDQTTRLINLSTSIFSTLTSEKNTLDELYKLIDRKLSITNNTQPEKQILEKEQPVKDEPKVLGVIRGIGGLNKQLVELNKSISTKVVPLLSQMVAKLNVKELPSSNLEKPVAPTAATPVMETKKIDPAASKIEQKKGESDAYKHSKMDLFSTGIGSLVGGGVLMGLGASIETMVSKFDSIAELADSITSTVDNLSTSIISSVEALPDKIADKLGSVLTNAFTDVVKKLFPNPETSAVDAGVQAVTIPDPNTGETPLESEAKEWWRIMKGGRNENVDELGKITGDYVGEAKQYFEKNKSPESTNSMVKPKPEKYSPKLRDTPQKIRGIHALDLYAAHKKSDISKYSIVNQTMDKLLTKNDIQTPTIAPITEAIKDSTSTLEQIKQNELKQSISTPTQPVVVQQSTHNNQTSGISGTASPRNNDSTKSILDKMSLLGTYTGTGFLVN